MRPRRYGHMAVRAGSAEVRGQYGWASGLGRRGLGVVGCEHGVAQALEHRHAADLGLEQRHDGADAVVGLPPDRLQMFLLHGDTLLDEVGGIRSDRRRVDDHVDQDAAHGDPEILEPLDEAGDDGDGQRLGQSRSRTPLASVG